MKKFLLLFGILIAFAACNTSKNAVITKVPDNAPEIALDADAEEEAESEDEMADDPGNYVADVYQATNRRAHDLIHTRLDLRFNWAEEKVIGKAELVLRPYFHASDKVTLDAKGFEFQKVSLSGKNMPLKYTYENDQIIIQLDRSYTRKEQYSILIEYTAMPSASGGSDAITSNKGLFFINPRGEEAGKPMQIWTQELPLVSYH
ncbi:MAG TPA: hypothetical protein PK198_16755 [Saprospiraceae bacterium]|nr:hypothetical protein [Saprospiraceae bacterium]